jgi:hypothetical protein
MKFIKHINTLLKQLFFSPLLEAPRVRKSIHLQKSCCSRGSIFNFGLSFCFTPNSVITQFSAPSSNRFFAYVLMSNDRNWIWIYSPLLSFAFLRLSFPPRALLFSSAKVVLIPFVCVHSRVLFYCTQSLIQTRKAI